MTTIRISDNNGFTLLEVIAVLILIAIISAVALSRGNAVKQSTLYTFAAELRANLRYVQNNSMATQSICSLIFNGNSYKFQDGDNTDQILPGQDQLSISAPSGVNMAPTSATIAFDYWGRPGANKTDNDDDGLLDDSASINITLSNSDDSITLAITQETGYITQ